MDLHTENGSLCNMCVKKNSCSMAKADEVMKKLYDIYESCDFTPLEGLVIDPDILKQTTFFLN